MYSQQPGHNTAAHQYDAQYQPQSSDERLWDDGFQKRPVPQKPPNYRPTPLRWYFIVSLIISIIALMALVVWAKLAMPNSDTSYTDLRHVEHRGFEERSVARPTSVQEEDDGDTTSIDEATFKMDAYRGTTTYTTKVSTIVTQKATTKTFTTMVPTTLFTTKVVSATEIVHSASVSTSWVPVTSTSRYVTKIVTSMPGSVTEIVTTSWISGWHTVPFTGSVLSSSPWSSPVEYTLTTTVPGTVVTSPSTVEETVTSSSSVEITQSGSTQTIGKPQTITKAIATSTVASTGTTTQAPTTFITLGKVTITSIYTDPNYKQPPHEKPTEKPQTKVVDVVSTEAGKTIKKVESLGAVTFVSVVHGTVQTIVASQPSETVVSRVGGHTTVVDVTSLGEDGLPTTSQVVSTVGGKLTTFVRTGPFEETITSDVNGMLTTFVHTDGLEKTITSDVGGFTTTFDLTTWGPDGLPTKTKVVSTSTGSLTTFVSTFTPSTKGKTKTFESTTVITPTETDGPEPTGEGVKSVPIVYNLDEGGYFVGKFLPPLLSIFLSIPARIIDLNAQLYQPFYALNRPNGALGPNGMTLHFGGWTGFLKPFQILTEGQPVTFFSMLLVWCAAIITPVATEAIGVKIHGYCTPVDPKGCAAALGASPTSTRALLALLALAIVLLCLLLFFLRNWDTGLYANPWSVAGIASLATNREVRPQRTTERKIAMEMRDKRYGFGYFENQHGQTEYGIVLYDDAGQNLRSLANPSGTLSEVSSIDSQDVARKKRGANPFIALGIAWRLSFMGFLLALMALILYYGTTFRSQNGFQNFMASQNFGIRFLFATLGVIISFGWGALFISVAMIVPYQVMSIMPQTASDSILLTRPTNPFSGIWSAFKHGQPFPALVALMAIFSEFMPLLLANVPYTITQTEITHKVCLWLSTSILGLMVLTISVSFYIVWPYMPVDPRSIAGAMYYVSESGMLNQFDGMASFNNKEREQRVREIGGRYWYGEVITPSGVTRPAVERDDGTLHTNDPVSKQPTLHINMNPHDIDTAYHGFQPEATVVTTQQRNEQRREPQLREEEQQHVSTMAIGSQQHISTMATGEQQHISTMATGSQQHINTAVTNNRQDGSGSLSASSNYPTYDTDVMYYDPPPETVISPTTPQHPGTTYYASHHQHEATLMAPQDNRDEHYDIDTPYYRHQH
ncbi:hypothetical protein BGZ63DRAFT_393749 [Mariannaea sp. PMI_226]|nr:hypothetical protein BGZ63DRAFT_393749 [Mariannaea sp. PMI_226]